mmetsp:Transcript_28409/g.53653  ORF Transcript_28409/g.53653 Transcript_28409/m.53653 type:complete len:128 (-) Transcript_28409:54-437(-)
MSYDSVTRSKLSRSVTIVRLTRGSIAVQTDNMTMFKNSKTIIGLMTSPGVTLIRLNFFALFMIFLIRLVLVNNALKTRVNPIASSHGNAIQVTHPGGNDNGIMEAPISSVPAAIMYRNIGWEARSTC